MSQSHGPGELLVLAFVGETVPTGVKDAVVRAASDGVIRLLDLVIASRGDGGDVSVLETDEVSHRLDTEGLALAEPGLIGAEDVEMLVERLGADESAVVVLFEHAWARDLVAAVRDADVDLVASERIPAVVLDEIASATGPS